MKGSRKRKENSFKSRLKHSWLLLLLFAPVFIYYVMFRYVPMLFTFIAFKDYNPFIVVGDVVQSIIKSPWAGGNGLGNFKTFIESPFFGITLRNTLVISLLDIAVVFTSSIIFALLLNTIKSKTSKSAIQIISYLPHFISIVVIAGMFIDFLSPPNGFIVKLLALFGADKNTYYLEKTGYFWGIFTLINLWKGMGWGSIVFVAALSRIDENLYEAASIDGASKLRQVFAVTLPGISLTIATMLIIKIGQVLNVGYDLIILLQNTQNYNMSNVLSVYVFNISLGSDSPFAVLNYGLAAAVGLFQAVFGCLLVVFANKISKKISEVSLW